MKPIRQMKSGVKRAMYEAANALAGPIGYTLEKRCETKFDSVMHALVDRPHKPFILQIGAHDGVSNDPLHHHIVRSHLEGLLVEPQPAAFTALQRNYRGEPQLKFDSCLIDEADGVARFYVIAENSGLPRNISQRASMSREVLLNCQSVVPDVAKHVRTVDVPKMSFDTLLTKHAVSRVDVLVMDTEGWDGKLLLAFDLARWRPGAVYFEHQHLAFDEYWKCLNYLVSNGYRFTQIGDNTLAHAEEIRV